MKPLFVDCVEAVDVVKVDIDILFSHVVDLRVVKIAIIDRVNVVEKLLGFTRKFVKRFVFGESEVDLLEIREYFFVRFSFHISMFNHVFSGFPVVKKDVIDIIMADFIFEGLVSEFGFETANFV